MCRAVEYRRVGIPASIDGYSMGGGSQLAEPCRRYLVPSPTVNVQLGRSRQDSIDCGDGCLTSRGEVGADTAVLYSWLRQYSVLGCSEEIRRTTVRTVSSLGLFNLRGVLG